MIASQRLITLWVKNYLYAMFKKISKFIKKHKLTSGFIVLVLIIGGYWIYQSKAANTNQPGYVLGTVEKGTIVVSVTGSGQVAAENQVDLTSKVTGNIVKMLMTTGQTVANGDTLVQLDTKDAQRTVRDAQASLDNAKLSLEKIIRGPRPEELKSAENAILNAQNALADSKTDLKNTEQSTTNDLKKAQQAKDYAETSLTNVKNKAQTDLANLYDDALDTLEAGYTKVDDTLNKQLLDLFTKTAGSYELTFSTNDIQGRVDTERGRLAADTELSDWRSELNLLKINSTEDDYNAAIIKAKEHLIFMQDFLLKLMDVVNQSNVTATVSGATINTYRSNVITSRTSMTSELSTINSLEQSISSQKITNNNNITASEKSLQDAVNSLATTGINNQNSLFAAKKKVTSAEQSVISAQNDLALKKISADPLDIQTQKLTVAQRQNDLQDAFDKLSDYTIKAPFSGVIVSVALKNGDSVSAGTVLGTLITKRQIAKISLNEVDVAKVALGQKATLTFDAIDGLSITGEVADIDAIGTVSQGVVTYNVKIGFDTNDDRVKPGMSVSAAIIIEAKSDVIIVPNSAIKTNNDTSYVEILKASPTGNEISGAGSANGVTSETLPTQAPVEIGIADDTNTEIISGLTVGDKIILRTITTGATTTQTAQPSLFGGGGGVRTGGGAGGAGAIR